MDIVTIDFETYYDKDYSLRKMTTEAYIRDERFEVLGVATKCGSNSPEWVSHNIQEHLDSLNLQDKAILAHNTVFDGAILSWIYNVKPKFWFDTMSMARPTNANTTGCSLDALAYANRIGAKGKEILNSIGKHKEDFTSEEWGRFEQYCINDVELTYKLFNKLKTSEEYVIYNGDTFPLSELMVIDSTIRMYTEPSIILDKQILKDHLRKVKAKKAKLLKDLTDVCKRMPDMVNFTDDDDMTRKVIMSDKKFAQLLERFGVEPPTKISPATGKLTYAFAKTDEEFVAMKDSSDIVVSTLVNTRLGTKSTIEETRTENLIKVADRGKLPIMLNYYGAHTGRFSGGDKLNLQNLPRNGAIRRALTADKGKVLIACDSSQIEARVLAWLAKETELVKAFKEGRDVYSEFASKVFGRKITKEDTSSRFIGKTCILGLGYGMGSHKYWDTVNKGLKSINLDKYEPRQMVSIEMAKQIVTLYRRENQNIVDFWQVCDYALQHIANNTEFTIANHKEYFMETESRGIPLPNGMWIKYPALHNHHGDWRYISNSRTFRKYIKAKVAGTSLEDKDWTNIYGGKITENIVQALARIIISEQMIGISKHYPIAFQVHDEIIVSVDQTEKSNALKLITETMSTPPTWAPDLPVACEAGVGSNYGEVK